MNLKAVTLSSHGVWLRPTRLRDAEDLVCVLADNELYRFIGGSPPNLGELRARLARQLRGTSPDGLEIWLNWVVRTEQQQPVVGTMQATVSERPNGHVAELAWMIGTAHQGEGLAKSAAALVSQWLEEQGVTHLWAHIHTRHFASQAVAASLGLHRADHLVDGEERWVKTP